jgi:hypothetical protein
MASVGLPHWLMITGVILVLFGLSGFALSRNRAVETDAAFLPGDVTEAEPAEEGEDAKAAR